MIKNHPQNLWESPPVLFEEMQLQQQCEGFVMNGQ